MRTPILSYLLLFLTAVLATVPASYGQDTPFRFEVRSGSGVDFKPDFSWNVLKPLTYVGNNLAFPGFFLGHSGGNRVDGRVITAHSPGSVAGKWQYRTSTSSSSSWTDLPAIGAGEGFLLVGGVSIQVRFIPLLEPGIVIDDASHWEQLREALANAETLPTFSYRLWDGGAGTTETVATLTDLGASISSLDTEKTATLEEITDNPLPAGRTETPSNPRFRAYFSEKTLLLADFSVSLGFGGLSPQNVAGEYVSGRVITAHSPGSVAGKWQHEVGSSTWEDLPAVDEGKGFLLEYTVNYHVRFVPQVAADNRLAAEQFAEAVANADTPPTISFRIWDRSQGTTETIATLADISTSLFGLTDDRTITLNRLTTRTERAAEAKAKKAATAEKAAELDALVDASDDILSAVQSSTAVSAQSAATNTEINTLKAEINVLQAAASQRDAAINTLKTAIAGLQQTGVSTPVNTPNPVNNAEESVLHVVAPSSADEGVRAYPNPTSRLLQVAGLAPAQTYIYRLHTSDGKHISQGTLLINEPIDISALGKGQYLLTIQDETGKQLFTTPLVVQ